VGGLDLARPPPHSASRTDCTKVRVSRTPCMRGDTGLRVHLTTYHFKVNFTDSSTKA